MLVVSQVASCMLGVGFCDAVLAVHSGHVVEEHSRSWPSLQTVVPLVSPAATVLLSTLLGVLSEATSQGFFGLHAGLILSGAAATVLGLVLAGLGGAGGLLLAAAGRAALGVGVRARLAEAVAPPRLAFAFGAAACLEVSGEAFGAAFATEGLLAPGLELGAAAALTLLTALLAALAEARAARRRRAWGDRLATAGRPTPERSADVEAAMEDPGARCAFLCSLLSWLAWWSVDLHLAAFLGEALGPVRGPAALLVGRSTRALVAAALALLLPGWLRHVGAFGAWLSCCLGLASLLLLGAVVRALHAAVLAEIWLASFGAVHAFLLSVPYVVMVQRAQACGTSTVVAVAVANVPSGVAQACWALGGTVAQQMLGSVMGQFCAGAVFAIWAAESTSRAVAYGKGSGHAHAPPASGSGGSVATPALRLPFPSKRSAARM